VLRLVTIRHGFLGDGYGHETPAGREAAALFRDAGLILDPTYTAKAAAGMLASVRAQRGGVHLFWHTLSAHEPIDMLDGVSAEELPEPFRRLLGSS
jgi:1-aminocyclopropane-1-carboxylate deaminase/D-cysteine desulfhydrase-like pyridoxal-dependent ACC family enzyme